MEKYSNMQFMVRIKDSFFKKYIFSYLTLSIIVFLIASFFFNKKILDEIDKNAKQNFFARIQTISASLDIANTITLSDNKSNPDKNYINLRKKLQNLLSLNPDIRMFYLISKQDDKLICLTDSDIVKTSNIVSQNLSEKAINEFNKVFLSQTPAFFGPVSDRLGKWLLVLIPVYGDDKGIVEAVFAMEVNCKLLNKKIILFNILSFLFTGAVCLLLITFTYILFYYSKVKTLLKTEMPDCINAEKEKKELTGQLKEAIAQIKILSGCLPICSSCKKIRDGEEGEWVDIETYISKYSEAEFSHGICPECSKVLYPKTDKK